MDVEAKLTSDMLKGDDSYEVGNGQLVLCFRRYMPTYQLCIVTLQQVCGATLPVSEAFLLTDSACTQ